MGRRAFALALLALLAQPGAATRAAQQPASPPTDRPKLVVQLGDVGGDDDVAFSPDGTLILTAADEGPLLWDARTGMELRRFAGSEDGIYSVAFDPGGRRGLMTVGDGTARLFDLATGAILRVFKGHASDVYDGAVSPDGTRVLTGSADNTARLWDANTGNLIQVFEGHTAGVLSVEFSPDGKTLITASADGTARLWQEGTVQEIRRVVGQNPSCKPMKNLPTSCGLSGAAMSPDSRTLLTAAADNTIKLWDVETGAELRTLEFPPLACAQLGNCGAVGAFSPDGMLAATGNQDGIVRIWEVGSGKLVRQLRQSPGKNDPPPGRASVYRLVALSFSRDGKRLATCGDFGPVKLWDPATGAMQLDLDGRADLIGPVAFSPDGSSLLTAANRHGLWNLGTGRLTVTFDSTKTGVGGAAFSPDGRRVLTGDAVGGAALWDPETGRILRTVAGHTDVVEAVGFSPDGSTFFTASWDGAVKLWNSETGTLIRTWPAHEHGIQAAAMSSNGRVLATAARDATSRVWDVESGRALATLSGHKGYVRAVAFSPDDRTILTGSDDGTAKLWDAATGRLVRTFSDHTGSVTAVAFFRDGSRVLTAGDDKTSRIWDAASGRELSRLVHSEAVSHIALSPDERRLLISGRIAELWDLTTRRQLCTLVQFKSGGWAAVDADGRFDTDALDGNPGLHWMMADDPLRALPLGVFARDYYEPGLMARLLAGKTFPPIRSLLDLNRVQPDVRIMSVTPTAADATRVDVTVEVARAERSFDRGGRVARMTSGAYDVRLFRDGQIVGRLPGSADAAGTGDDSLDSWRRANRVTLDPATGRASLTFRGIQIPDRVEPSSISFTAYAFNDDRVKSEVSTRAYAAPASSTVTPGRAYVVTIGVDGSQNAAFRLRFAANDAIALGATLSARLRALGEYRDVVAVPLISRATGAGGSEPQLATKAGIKAVLDRLSGRPADPRIIERIPNAASLATARPGDLVILSFSGHGHADGKGGYFLLPSDIGAGSRPTMTPQILARSISNGELSDWLRDVDAGHLALIVDACHSAATVEAGDFKPGPMGSRGLGQLAYDKRMAILTASQAADVAWEYDALQHGLLTYALVREGLDRGLADHKPKDGAIQMTEWLGYAAARVPVIDRALRERRFEALGLTAPRGLTIPSRTPAVQSPVLFNFAGTGSDRTIAR